MSQAISEMKTEAPEISVAQQLQIKYNQLCGEYGHLEAQIKANTKRMAAIDMAIEKVLNKAKNLPKAELESVNKEAGLTEETLEEGKEDGIAS